MYLFLKRVLLFTTVVLSYFLINYLVNSYFISKNKSSLHLISKTLVIGDSHQARAFDEKFYKGMRNISQNSEPYYLSYWKIKEVLKKNTIDTIILGFSYHNLSTFNDKKLSDKKWSKEMYRRSYTIADFSKLKSIPIDYISYYKVILQEMCLTPSENHINYIGKYKNSTNTNFNDLDSTIERHFYNSQALDSISLNELQYLNSIINLCKEKKVNLFLVTTPLHKMYREKIPKIFIAAYKEQKKIFEKKGITVLNYGSYDFENNEFLNSDHLNASGAKHFSQVIYNQLHEKTYNTN